jgi:hypothetical protein
VSNGVIWGRVGVGVGGFGGDRGCFLGLKRCCFAQKLVLGKCVFFVSLWGRFGGLKRGWGGCGGVCWGCGGWGEGWRVGFVGKEGKSCSGFVVFV